MEKAAKPSRGDMVSWNSSGGRATGKIERIVREGSLDVPNSSFTINAEPDDPAVLIRVYRNDRPTSVMVGHKMSSLNTVAKANPYRDRNGRFSSGPGGGGASIGSGSRPGKASKKNPTGLGRPAKVSDVKFPEGERIARLGAFSIIRQAPRSGSNQYDVSIRMRKPGDRRTVISAGIGRHSSIQDAVDQINDGTDWWGDQGWPG